LQLNICNGVDGSTPRPDSAEGRVRGSLYSKYKTFIKEISQAANCNSKYVMNESVRINLIVHPALNGIEPVEVESGADNLPL
jgi:hypothetical protein